LRAFASIMALNSMSQTPYLIDAALPRRIWQIVY
jgi:hypothetical protein